MPLWLQHSLVLIAVALCAAFVIWAGVQSFRGRRKSGSCASCKSCDPNPAQPPPSPPPHRIAIIPADMLRKR